MSCGECKQEGRQNSKGFKCCLGSDDDSFDVLRFNGSVLRVHKDKLVSEYDLYCKERKEAYNVSNRLNLAGEYSYLEWILKVQKICPHSILSKQSKYLIETINLCRTEFGVSLPFPDRGVTEQPALFYDALSVIDRKRAEVREAKSG